MSPRAAAKPLPEPVPPHARPPRVVLRRRSRGPGDFDEEEVEWPRGWPLPDPGSTVVGDAVRGLVRSVEFDLRGARIVVLLV